MENDGIGKWIKNWAHVKTLTRSGRSVFLALLLTAVFERVVLKRFWHIASAKDTLFDLADRITNR